MTDEEICIQWEKSTGVSEREVGWDVIGFARDLLKANGATDESLNCDFCGVSVDDPWHTSDATRKHLHQCDACHIATCDAALIDVWVSASEALPTKPGNYLAMMADENSFGYPSNEPVIVEFDAYTDHPQQFTISDSWTNGPETATEEITFWMPMPTPPIAASAPRDK